MSQDEATSSAEARPSHHCFNDEILRCSEEWPCHEKISIDWRMPQDNQRVFIFERLQRAVELNAQQESEYTEVSKESETFRESQTSVS